MKSVETPLGVVKFDVTVDGHAELQLFELPQVLQNGMTVDQVIACYLTVEPSIDAADLVFSAKLENERLLGSFESGEYLECISWESKDWAVSLGTEDSEALSRRLDLKIDRESYPITYSHSGLELRLNGLKKGLEWSFHFIVAYKRLPDDRQCSTWFAVDVPHEMANKARKADGF